MSKVNMSNFTDNVKTFVQGALGAMTFGMYHQYTSNRLIELHVRQMQTEMKQKEMETDAKLHQKELVMDAKLAQKELETDAKLAQKELEIQELRKNIAQLQRRWF